jgi:hypothetical protein
MRISPDPSGLHVGIDQHRKQLTVSVRDASGSVTRRRQVSTEWKKIRAFFDEIGKMGRSSLIVTGQFKCSYLWAALVVSSSPKSWHEQLKN